MKSNFLFLDHKHHKNHREGINITLLIFLSCPPYNPVLMLLKKSPGLTFFDTFFLPFLKFLKKHNILFFYVHCEYQQTKLFNLAI